MSKVCIVAIAKNENAYIREWVEYHKNIGIDKIFLFDNNDKKGEKFEDVINDHIESGFVELINYKGKKQAQCKAYQKCYKDHNGEYDWMCFIDADEFITLSMDNDIHTYLENEMFNDYDMIHLNYLTYGDNDKIEYENKPLIERFQIPLPINHTGPLDIPNNNHSKTILRGGIKNVKWTDNCHTLVDKQYKCCNNRGMAVNSLLSVVPIINYDCAFIRHYSTKTISEYLNTKYNRADAILKKDNSISNFVGDVITFFSFNRITNDKIDYVKNFIKEHYE